jgi:ABC-type uncharacterized transport system permease subunit
MDIENEIITAVVILYVLLSVAIVLVHYLQPKDQETKTSSPSHIELQEGGSHSGGRLHLSVIITLVVALLPLVYVKWKDWLR